ncbi:MAG TPA: hypothetical protein VG455_08125 [Acidimicrobiales bacterium]|nr:hypothetical protein [Acidimicrobiales bacterium]
MTIADDHLGHAEEVAAELRAAGMTVDRVLGTIGLITGSVNPSERPSVEAVPGVAGVEEETTFQVAPPDAEIQ